MKTNLLHVSEITCTCAAGAEISACAKEAAMMALEYKEKVKFIHNDRKYTADPHLLVMLVLETENPRR